MFFRGKVALITGGARGIGLDTSKELLRREIKGLVLTDVDEKLGEKTTKQLQDEFSAGRVIFVRVDNTNQEEFEDAFKAAIKTFEGIDIVINNAGIVNEEDYCKTVDINLVGTIRGTKLALKYMSKEFGGLGGTILNISSLVALSTAEFPPVYVATKCAILGLSCKYGKEMHFDATGVRFVALCPGCTDTTLVSGYSGENKVLETIWDKGKTYTPLQKPESVAKAAAYAIEKGASGSMWIIIAEKLYKANMPGWQEYSELVEDFN